MKLRHLLRECDVRNHGDEQVLSAYRDLGVIPKDGRDDNFNKTPEDVSNYKLVLPGDVVVNKMKAWQGSIAVSEHRGIVSADYLVCRITGDVDRRYLHHLLRSRPMIAEYAARSRGIRPSQWRLYWEDLSDVPVALPDAPRQRAIADFLDTETVRIDALTTKKRRMIHLLNQWQLARIYGAVTGAGLSGPRRESGVDWIGEVPAHWGVPWLGAHYATQLGKMLNEEAAVGPDQYPYVRNTNVHWDYFELDGLATMHFGQQDRVRCALRLGDLLVCEGGEVGRAAVWPGSPSAVYFQKAIHRVRALDTGNTRFLMYCLRAAACLNVFTVEGNQSTIVHLTGEKLREHRFPFPPLEEQADIVRNLDSDRDRTQLLTEHLTRQISLLQEHRQALITAAVTGELETPGAAA